ncbi:uncharacterized protein [Drosophila bipectinata]|uniref:uncharacterized protein n=1 Tax=Drosophila bipectinata TaxID=42026 RepID=UPI0038B2648A
MEESGSDKSLREYNAMGDESSTEDSSSEHNPMGDQSSSDHESLEHNTIVIDSSSEESSESGEHSVIFIDSSSEYNPIVIDSSSDGSGEYNPIIIDSSSDEEKRAYNPMGDQSSSEEQSVEHNPRGIEFSSDEIPTQYNPIDFESGSDEEPREYDPLGIASPPGRITPDSVLESPIISPTSQWNPLIMPFVPETCGNAPPPTYEIGDQDSVSTEPYPRRLTRSVMERGLSPVRSDGEESPTKVTTARSSRVPVPGSCQLVSAWLDTQDRHSFAPGHLEQCREEARVVAPTIYSYYDESDEYVSSPEQDREEVRAETPSLSASSEESDGVINWQFHEARPEEQRRAAVAAANERWIAGLDPMDYQSTSEESGVEDMELEEEAYGEEEESGDDEAENPHAGVESGDESTPPSSPHMEAGWYSPSSGERTPVGIMEDSWVAEWDRDSIPDIRNGNVPLEALRRYLERSPEIPHPIPARRCYSCPNTPTQPFEY